MSVACAGRMRRRRAEPVFLPASYHGVAAFLTFRCPYRCSYCISRFGTDPRGLYAEMPGADWIAFFERLQCRDVPLTLQGGEPGCHPDFIEIVRESSRLHAVYILTNLAFDLSRFVREVDAARLNRAVPHAAIQVSYHPRQFTLSHILDRVEFLRSYGFRVGLAGLQHPGQAAEMEEARRVCEARGVDFRLEPFLGLHEGRLHGDYAYRDACGRKSAQRCDCQPSELLIAPDGMLFPCHHHLYSRVCPIGRIGRDLVVLPTAPLPCAYYGQCNPCDVKVKGDSPRQSDRVPVNITLRD